MTDTDTDSREDARQTDASATDTSPTADWGTEGRVIRPFFDALDAFVGEARIVVTETGALTVSVVDPANVALFEQTLTADAFESVTPPAESEEFGVNVNRMAGQLRRVARKGKRTSDDMALSLDVDGLPELTAEGWRTFDDETTIRQQTTAKLIDPDSLRASQDVPEADLDTVTDWFSADALRKTFAHVAGGDADYIRLETDADDLVISQSEARQEDTVALTGVLRPTTGDGPSAIYSSGYVRMAEQILGQSLADRVRIRYDDEYPMRIDWERGDRRDLTATGSFFLAPRIQSTVD